MYSGFNRESHLPISGETSDQDIQRQSAATRWKADFSNKVRRMREEGAPSYRRIVKAKAYVEAHAMKHAKADD